MWGNRNILTHELGMFKVGAKRLYNTKFFALLAVLEVLVGSLCLSPAISSLMNSVIIRNSGEISIPTITAASGSATDIQAAVDWVVAHGGIGNVYIPEGTFNFVEVGEPWMTVEIPAGVNLFGAPTERGPNELVSGSYDHVVEWKTILVMPWDVPGNDTVGIPRWFRIIGDGDPDKPSRFSDIKLVGYRSIDPESTSMHVAVGVDTVIDFRIDHCYFEHTTAGVGCHSGYQKPTKIRGVIDHCKFINEHGTPVPYDTRTIGYGVQVRIDDHYYVWDPIDQVLGHYNNYTVFIEDCYFEKWRHCICTNTGGHIVFRHNTINNDFGYGSLDQHEQRGPCSGRALEIYENQLLDPIEGWGKDVIWWRGGGGVAFNNTVVGYDAFACLSENAEYQEEIYRPHDIWIWNNSLPPDCVDISVYGNLQEGVHYWRHAPHTFNYQPYPYPHPLTLKEIP